MSRSDSNEVPNSTPEGGTHQDGTSEDPAAPVGDQAAPSERRERLEQAALRGRTAVAGALNEARQRQGLSYRALDRLSGIRVATLQGWLTGKYTPQVGMRKDFIRLIGVLGLADPPDVPGGVRAVDWWEAIQEPSARSVRPADSTPPYPGMLPYDLSTAHMFAGRDGPMADLRTRLQRRLEGRERPLLLVTGRSGVGKSSLVAATAAQFAPDVETVILSPSTEALEVLQSPAGDVRRIVVLDHTETLWTSCPPQLAGQLLDAVSAVQEKSSSLALVLVMRADAIAPATDIPLLQDALEHAHFVLGPIDRKDVVQIMEAPTSGRGVTVEPRVIDLVLNDLGADTLQTTRGRTDGVLVGALPLISQTMRMLWVERRAPEAITIADYHRTGGIAASVETTAEAAFARLSAQGQAVCWPVLREMIRMDEERPSRVTATKETFTSAPAREVLQVFLASHLLLSSDAGITIGHDLLFTTWPRLTDWLASAKNYSAARRMLTRYARFWDDSGRPDDLLRTTDASIILASEDETDDRGSLRPPLPRVERDFLVASRHAHNAQLHEAEEENRSLKKSARRFRTVTAFASSFAVVALVLAVTALVGAHRLDDARATALGNEIASRSEVVAETLPSQAAQLAVSAFGIDDNAATRSRLLSLSASALPRDLQSVAGPGALAAVSDLVAQGGSDSTVHLIDPISGEVLHEIATPSSHTYALSLVDLGDRVLLAAAGEDISGDPPEGCVWEVEAEPRKLGCLTIPAASNSVAVLPDGSGVLFGSGDGTIQRMRLQDGSVEVLPALRGPGGDESAPSAVMGLDAAAGTVIAAAEDGTVAALDDPLGDGRWSAPLQTGLVQSVSLAADGTRFAVATRDHTVVIGNILGTEGEPHELEPVVESSAFESWTNHTEFLPDGRIAAVGSDQTLRIIDGEGVVTRTQTLASLPTQLAVTDSVLATYTVDGTILLWPLERFVGQDPRGRVFEVVSDDSGTLAASLGSADGLLQVERLGEDGVHTPITVPDTDIETRYGIDVSPDGKFVASAGRGGLQIWRVGQTSLSTPTVIDPLPDALIIYVKFAPDGSRIAVGDQSEDTVVVYDLEDAPGSGGAEIELRKTSEIPVLAGGTMDFVDRDTLVVEDGSWELLVWDLDSDEALASVSLDGERPAMILARPGHPGQIAFATESRSVGLLDLTEASAPRVLSRATDLTDTPRSLDFSPDGSTLAIAAVSHVDIRSVSADGTDIGTSQLRLTGPMRTEIADVSYLDGGKRIVGSTYSGNLWWWDLDTERVIEHICDAVGTPLTLEKARQLAPSFPEDGLSCES
ncbi:WD40 repeat protein [Brachybacterium muris]|uniref:nSTAND1 domain-containing NTPase n=1 Tax=Brachybacterium muris TaxID=219301 RepID=UPI00195E3FC1|nr:AAA family ATPase [Brachybacterium muris]MBM7502056.1 WD40 repeat protein [Brachybacterium muris]